MWYVTNPLNKRRRLQLNAKSMMSYSTLNVSEHVKKTEQSNSIIKLKSKNEREKIHIKWIVLSVILKNHYVYNGARIYKKQIRVIRYPWCVCERVCVRASQPAIAKYRVRKLKRKRNLSSFDCRYIRLHLNYKYGNLR